MSNTEARGGAIDGLVGTVFPRLVLPRPPPETEIVELLEAPDIDAWVIEHEITRDGHECEDVLLRYRDEAKPAVYCPECRLLVGAQRWGTVSAVDVPSEPTHAETAALVLRANLGTGMLVGAIAWLTSLGFTTPGLALLIAVGALGVYAAVTAKR
jgi:hypothetical protein